jgi:hypothetical protein
MGQKSPKKSETIEVRVPYATKAAFVAKCRGDGRTVSDAVRQFMAQELEATSRSQRGRARVWQAVAAAVAGLALGAVAAPSLAHPTANSRAAFERLDRNHDGLLSFDEFRRG